MNTTRSPWRAPAILAPPVVGLLIGWAVALAAVAAEPLLPCAVPRATTAGGTAGVGGAVVE